MNKNQYKIAGLAFGTLVLLLCFQNCGTGIGEGFTVTSSMNQLGISTASDTSSSATTSTGSDYQSTGDICEDQLYAKFGSGYYVFLRNNCAGCHNGEHEAPAFASPNQYMSYQIFKDKGYLAISNNAVNQNHNYPATGPQNAGAISSLKAEWEAAQTEWATCQGTNTADTSVVTSNITNAAIVANKDNSAIWSKLTWNFTTTMPAKSATFPLELSLEAQVAKVSGIAVGYAIRNPVIKMTSGTAKYRVRGLFFYLNGKMIDAATTYRNINAVVCPNTSLELAPVGNAQLLVQATQKNTDTFAVQFSAIEKVDASTACGTGSTEVAVVDTTPATVSFTQLISTDAKLGVFRSQCFSCHVGTTSRAGLDLSDYTQAKAKASKILLRINDSASPMPTSGMMSSSMRSIVEKWVSTGAPK